MIGGRDAQQPGSHPLDKATQDLNGYEMSKRRTGLSFQRTRMSADRTLMSIIRTSLSLISFGFTIFQFFQKFKIHGVEGNSHAARNFGETLAFIGIAMLMVGIVYHVVFMLDLRKERTTMVNEDLIHGESPYPVSMTLITAILVLIVGVLALLSMMFHVGPYE